VWKPHTAWNPDATPARVVVGEARFMAKPLSTYSSRSPRQTELPAIAASGAGRRHAWADAERAPSKSCTPSAQSLYRGLEPGTLGRRAAHTRRRCDK